MESNLDSVIKAPVVQVLNELMKKERVDHLKARVDEPPVVMTTATEIMNENF